MIYIENNSNDPYFNLAFEEFCLGSFNGLSGSCVGGDCVYFLLWRTAPSVILGKNQDLFQEVDFRYAGVRGINLVRRITGGGAVYHDLGNLNISIIGNYELHPDYAEVFGELVTRALRAVGLKDVVMNGRNDLFVEGRKVSGWAKRIQGNAFLLHGTLLYDVNLDQLERVLQTEAGKLNRKAVKSVRSVVKNIRDLVPFEDLDGLRMALQKVMRGDDGVICLNEEQLSVIRRLVEEKYRTDEWIYNLPFHPTVSKGFQTGCGFIVLNVKVDDGRLAAVQFRGDFLGNRDSEELCKRMVGAVWSEAGLAEALEGVQVSDYFTGLTKGELLDAFVSLL